LVVGFWFCALGGYSWDGLAQEIARLRNRLMSAFDDAPVSDFIWGHFWISHPDIVHVGTIEGELCPSTYPQILAAASRKLDAGVHRFWMTGSLKLERECTDFGCAGAQRGDHAVSFEHSLKSDIDHKSAAPSN
jgi:hypothetical protein